MPGTRPSPARARNRNTRRPHRTRWALAAVTATAATAAVLVGVGTAAAAPHGTSDTEAVPTGGIAFPSPTGVPPTTPPPGPGSPAENQVFTLLNQQRAAHGLGPLTWSAQLATAARGHNLAMSNARTLSHQLPGEPDFAQRISNTGYAWRAAAENIGYTGQASDAGAISIQTMFYDETPPNDGHRRNILSTATTQVGVSVLVDGRGLLWVTEDFAAPR